MSEESTIRDPKENLLDWLRDVHAMAHQAEQMLRAQSSRLENYPDLKARIDQHLEETLVNKSWLPGAMRAGRKHVND
jgi:ferritin-like metal-binding protein YciE